MKMKVKLILGTVALFATVGCSKHSARDYAGLTHYQQMEYCNAEFNRNAIFGQGMDSRCVHIIVDIPESKVPTDPVADIIKGDTA